MDKEKILTALHPGADYRAAYSTVDQAVREYFEAHPDYSLSTAELAKGILPPIEIRGALGPAIQRRLFTVLQKLADNSLSDCATRGKAKQNTFKRTVHPWLWHRPDGSPPRRPTSVRACPRCGELID